MYRLQKTFISLTRPYSSFNHVKRLIASTSFTKPCKILGIETSCDDTGCAVVNEKGEILGEALHSQEAVHFQHGGIIPPIAEDLHRENIASVVENAMKNIAYNDIDAIAVTTRPGLPKSLKIGMKYAKHLCRLHKKPLIPIHHMEAHTLTARMQTLNASSPKIEFPFLVLLISGGNCLLAVAQEVDKFLLLGESIDDSPGEAMDKLVRRMKLRNMPEFANMSGGCAMETLASRATNPLQFKFLAPMSQYKDCNFSYAGLKNAVQRAIIREEKELGLGPDEVIPSASNLAAALHITIVRHLCHRLQRGMEFCKIKGLIPSQRKQLIVSGGVACNNFINRGLEMLCKEMGYVLHRPPPKLCTDNGVMIAWNGVERWQANIGVLEDFNSVDIEKDSPIGTNIIDQVKAANLSCKWVRLKGLTDINNDVSVPSPNSCNIKVSV